MRTALREVLCVILSLIAALAVAMPASGQFAYNSSIDGKVLDESGAALPGVMVTLSGPALQAARASVTDIDGRYRFLELPAGVFAMKYELAGFQTFIRSDLQVSVAFAARVDVEAEDRLRGGSRSPSAAPAPSST